MDTIMYWITMLMQQGKLPALLILSIVINLTNAQQMCDECNCQVSTTEADRLTIRNMGLVCNYGTLKWYGVSGGLLLEVAPFIHGDFKACFVIDSDADTYVKVSKEISHIPRRKHTRARSRDAKKRFSLVHLSTSTGRSNEFCVVSRRREPLVIYIETDRTPEVGSVPRVAVHYDIQEAPRPSDHGVYKLDDCRPCTKQEILDSYCSMDFVVIGSLGEVQDNVDTDKTDITINAKQIIHSTQPNAFQRVKRSNPHLTGNVVVPKKCGVKWGSGDFLFTGRMRLGSLSLQCSPYLEDWRKIQHEAECTHS